MTSVVSGAGSVQERYVYDAYGTSTVLDSSWSVRSGGSSYQFTNRYQGLAEDTATGLLHARFRDVHPTLGRPLQRDPLGFLAGDQNVYRWTDGNPVTLTDPLGLDPPTVEMSIPSENQSLRGAFGGGVRKPPDTTLLNRVDPNAPHQPEEYLLAPATPHGFSSAEMIQNPVAVPNRVDMLRGSGSPSYGTTHPALTAPDPGQYQNFHGVEYFFSYKAGTWLIFDAKKNDYRQMTLYEAEAFRGAQLSSRFGVPLGKGDWKGAGTVFLEPDGVWDSILVPLLSLRIRPVPRGPVGPSRMPRSVSKSVPEGPTTDGDAHATPKITFGHGARHLEGSGLSQIAVESAIARAVRATPNTGTHWGWVQVGGQWIQYRAHVLPDGTINIGTYVRVPGNLSNSRVP